MYVLHLSDLGQGQGHLTQGQMAKNGGNNICISGHVQELILI